MIAKGAWLTGFVVVIVAGALAPAQGENRHDPAAIECFEARIRPVLVEHCYRCHSSTAKKLKGKLLLDSRAGILKGGESGPALVAGKPEKSRLIEAIHYTN